MKSFKFFILAFATIGLLFFSNCSEDDNPTDNNGNGDHDYYPMNIGNYWIYDNNDLDKDGKHIEGTFSMDSVVVTEYGETQGKSAYKQVAYTKENEADAWEYDSETYFYSEEGKLYGLFGVIAPDEGELPIPIDFGDGWILFADDNASSWEIFSMPIEDIEFDFQGLPLTINGDFSVSGKKGSSTTFEINGVNVPAQEYIINFEFDGKVSYLILSYDLPFSIIGHMWYAEDIGLIEYTTDPTTVGITELSIAQQLDGNESLLIRYYVD